MPLWTTTTTTTTTTTATNERGVPEWLMVLPSYGQHPSPLG